MPLLIARWLKVRLKVSWMKLIAPIVFEYVTQRGVNGVEAGPLAGTLVRTLQNRIKVYTTTALSGFDNSNKYLAEFMSKLKRTGSLIFDELSFKTAFDRDPDAFSALTLVLLRQIVALKRAFWHRFHSNIHI